MQTELRALEEAAAVAAAEVPPAEDEADIHAEFPSFEEVLAQQRPMPATQTVLRRGRGELRCSFVQVLAQEKQQGCFSRTRKAGATMQARREAAAGGGGQQESAKAWLQLPVVVAAEYAPIAPESDDSDSESSSSSGGGSFRSADFDGDVDAAVDAGLLLRPERPEEAAEAGAALARELQRERAREQLRAAKLAV